MTARPSDAPGEPVPGPHAAAAADAVLRELEALRERERQMMELLGTHSADRLLHDLRNVLNEVNLLRAVVGDSEES